MNTQQTPAPRPAAVDLDAARVHAAGLMRMGKPEAAWEINALVADLAATRAERDAAWDELALLHAEADIGSEIARDEMERVTAERDAARARLTDAEVHISTLELGNGPLNGLMEDLERSAADWRERAEDAEADRDAALAASAALVRTLDAHTVLLESCDRDGQAYCDCLDTPLAKARALDTAPTQEVTP